MEDKNLKTYAMLARLGFPKSYWGKVMLVAYGLLFVLAFCLLAYLFLGAPAPLPLVLLVIATLASAASLWMIRSLLAPIRIATSSLKSYRDNRKVPELPVGFSDEAGRLMANVQHTVEDLDTSVRPLQRLAGTDHLTGLLNRRAGEDRLSGDLSRAKRSEGTLTVAVVDVNEFKAINDTHGHQAGDVCIRHAADVIQRNMREGDWLARWGGDEFVMMWDTSVFASPEVVLRRINADLRESPVRLTPKSEMLLSISVGACRYSGEEDFRELLAKADAAMYEAKREGRAWVLAKQAAAPSPRLYSPECVEGSAIAGRALGFP